MRAVFRLWPTAEYWTRTMPRKVRDSNLETRTARARLKVAHKPYVRLIEPGLHLGYRKLASGPGTWLARRYNGGGKYAVENLRTPDGALIIADDYSEADGHSVLSFGQAQERAKARRRAAGKHSGPYKVADAMDAYLAWLESEGRSNAAVADARYRDRAFIRSKLGELEVASLTADKLRQWRDALAKAAPRLRTRAGEKQKHRDMENNEEARRSRRASANRTWTTLRAALNHAFHHTDKIDSDKAWRKVKPFKSVDKARVRYLTVAEAKRLINGCDPEFRPLLQASLLTGGRYSQVVQLSASDFNADAGTLRMRTRKGNGSERIHHVHLTAEGVRFFESASAGRAGADLIFTKEDGSAWGKSHQARPMREAVGRAKIKPAIGFHGLRHTWASHAVMNGVPLMVVAKNLGHSDTRMVEKHYGHLAPSYIADAIRAGAPRFGIEMDTRVAPIRGRR
jgi:integrase